MGFRPQIQRVIDLGGLPGKVERQTLMFSWTFDSKIRVIADKYLVRKTVTIYDFYLCNRRLIVADDTF